jgi:hypothetical protein
VNFDTAASHADAIWGHAAFHKDAYGIVHLGGLIMSGTVGGAAYVLPEGYCPGFHRVFPVLSANTLGRVTVRREEDGSCDVFVEVANSAWLSLDGISFRVKALEDE